MIHGRRGGTRTHNLRFWRPLLYQLNYSPKIKLNCNLDSKAESPIELSASEIVSMRAYLITSAIRPAPIVRPPSRIAKR